MSFNLKLLFFLEPFCFKSAPKVSFKCSDVISAIICWMSNIELFKIELVRDRRSDRSQNSFFYRGSQGPSWVFEVLPWGTNSGILQPIKGGWVPEAKMPKHQARPDVFHGFSTLPPWGNPRPVRASRYLGTFLVHSRKSATTPVSTVAGGRRKR